MVKVVARRLLGLSVVLVLAAVMAPVAAAFPPGYYSHSTSACSSSGNRVDPVTVVWYYDALVTRIKNHIESHLGWTNASGSGQWFKVDENPEECVVGGGDGSVSQRASAGGSSTRNHVRYAVSYNSWDPTFGQAGFGTPHYETYNTWSCFPGGHAVSSPDGFNTARNVLVNSFLAAGHTNGGYQNWNNSQRMLQCDDEYAWNTDGRAYFVRISSSSP